MGDITIKNQSSGVAWGFINNAGYLDLFDDGGPILWGTPYAARRDREKSIDANRGRPVRVEWAVVEWPGRSKRRAVRRKDKP